MTPPIIKTPRGTIIIGKNFKVELKWNTNFQSKWQKRFTDVQKYVDSEVIRVMEPYTPMRTGMLIKSHVLGTVIGSGTVSAIAPYARKQYFSPRKPGSETGPLRGPFWFERAMQVHKQGIFVGMRRIVGGKK